MCGLIKSKTLKSVLHASESKSYGTITSDVLLQQTWLTECNIKRQETVK